MLERPERLSLNTLMTLLDILGCSMEELIEPVAVAAQRRKAAGDAAESHGGLGGLRPTRARIVKE